MDGWLAVFCSLDWICEHAARLRVHPTGGHGSPWTWACVVEKRGELAILTLASRAPDEHERRAILSALWYAGFHERLHERIKGEAGPRPVRKRIRPPRAEAQS